jgi:hypothetical protein
MSSIVFNVCGWQLGEHVQVTTMLPSGWTNTEDYLADIDDSGTNSFGHVYLPSISDPQGVYTFIAEGDTSGSTQFSVEITIPPGPLMFWAYREQGLILYNFQPNEHIRLLRFGLDGKFNVWQEYSMDPQGYLLVKLDVPPDPNYKDSLYYYYIALGDQSGEVFVSGTPLFDKQGPPLNPILKTLMSPTVVSGVSTAYCPSVLPSRVEIKTRARAAFTNGQNLRVREQPGFSYARITSIPEGTTFSIEDGPLCADNTSWWRIRTDNNVVGWVAEEQDGAYLIEPY